MRYELQPVERIAMAADGRRRRFVGQGMVQPKVPMTWRDSHYGLLTFTPGRDQISVNHAAVHAHPLNFEAARAKDVETRSVLVKRQERAVKSGGRTRAGVTRASVTPRGSTPLWLVDSATRRPRLNSAGRREWRLP